MLGSKGGSKTPLETDEHHTIDTRYQWQNILEVFQPPTRLSLSLIHTFPAQPEESVLANFVIDLSIV